MWQSAQYLRLLMLPLLAAGLLGPAAATAESEGGVRLSANGGRITIHAPLRSESLEVAPLLNGRPGSPLMGRIEAVDGGAVFVPVAPLLPGNAYRVRWQTAGGDWEQTEIQRTAANAAVPKVSISPEGPLPANALKVYLHFTEPMEQGVFLDRLRLLDEAGKEVLGAFRETELWSPSGRRLTVWFHPGRQKTGVNLNADEGPVLHPHQKYRLVVAGSWRSIGGAALGEDVAFSFSTTDADHATPRLADWRITVPRAGSREALRVRFDEPLDMAMLLTALRVLRQDGTAVAGVVTVIGGKDWAYEPQSPWQAGDYALHADPQLEDLAGNNLAAPFEVDLSQEQRGATQSFVLPFKISAAP
jgi:hypothetical protein